MCIRDRYQRRVRGLTHLQMAEPEEGRRSLRERLDDLKVGDFICRECVCGFSCGTEAVWDKHLAQSSMEHYPAWCDPQDPTRARCMRWPGTNFCTCRVACELASLEDDPTQVAPGVYLGSIIAAWNVQRLRELGVTHILDISRKQYHRHQDDFEYKVVGDCKDNPKSNISRYFGEVTEWIQEAIAGGGVVFIHCHWGQSRSATLVLAYLIKKEKISYDAAFLQVSAERPEIRPNSGFVFQLRSYSARLGLEENPPTPGWDSSED
eukprot:TRINITY_DN55175_c0_g1_i2.p1 TRINITY_DN55175_c0_g1~~TRINITY_DN55175_c0_g1_i2.p1  ORF type:complete len:264 (+),score=30.71 TRINITY_DN55175_c0_g1_i2:123-914(+)